ncbi:MAG TPA: hypothetical protein VGX23_07725 [Actinocrinis sp.]|nr:hypothetical protein [Actinocrinis sp.]
MTVVAVGPETQQGTTGGGTAGGTRNGTANRGERAQRSTPRRLRVGATVAAALVGALLAVVVATFTIAQNAATTVSSRAATASSASDLYFALSDLDAEASRQVLLGDGTSGNGVDYGSSALTALAQYNTRNQQADADLGQLSDSSASGQVNQLAHEITTYRQFAAQSISLDQDTGALAGQSSPSAQGYYSIASTLMKSTVLPQAANLRDSTAAQLATAASNAHRDAMIGAVASGVLGLAALLALLVLHRRISRWFRRSVNPGVLLAAVLVAVLAGAAADSLAGLSRDTSDAGTSFAGYLAVTRARAAAYDADAAVTRYLLAPTAITGDPLLGGGTGNPVAQALTSADAPITALSAGDDAIGGRWKTVSSADLPKITRAAAGGDVDTALALDTGIARGQDAFDFYYFDSSLLDLSNTRLAAFTGANSDSQNELADWGWLPWALAGAALVAIAAGVRPRLSEFR